MTIEFAGVELMAEVDAYISLNDARKHFPGRPHITTLHRWSLKGVRGVKLETVVIGQRRFVTREAINRFIRRLNTTDAERLASEGC